MEKGVLWKSQVKSGGAKRMPRVRDRGRYGKSGGNEYDVRTTD